MDDLFLRFTELLDNRFTEHTKNLDQDVDSKVHAWVDPTFQLLKSDPDYKLEDTISATMSKVTEFINNKFNQLHSKVDSTMELKLDAVDSAVSSKLDTILLTDTLLTSIDSKLIENMIFLDIYALWCRFQGNFGFKLRL